MKARSASMIAGIGILVLSLGIPMFMQLETIPVVRDPLPPNSLQQIMQGIYDAEKRVTAPDHAIAGVIVPHHLTASEGIASGIRMLAKQQPKTILLISPDHFHKCPTLICTTRGIFTTVLGDVRTQNQLVNSLAHSPLVTLDNKLFNEEHGIGAITPYIKYNFPDAVIVPVVLSQKIHWYENRETILKALQGVYDQVDAIVISSDFSHYLTVTKADQMDEETAEVLFAGDLQGIAALNNPDQNDCPGCLWILANIAKNNDFYNPSVILHTNSARILKDERVKETTSHFTIVWYKNNDLTSDDFAVAGDVTMTRTMKTPQLRPAMKRFWNGRGLRFVNLEGPLSTNCAPNREMFTFCNAEQLWKGMLGLATHWAVLNNHSLDQHTEGLDETKRIIAAAGETWVGDSMINEKHVRLISLTALMNPVIDAQDFDISASYQRVIHELRTNAATGSLVVVLVHAGREYAALGSDSYHEYLRTFIDAGADVVVAAHTHVLSDMEMYKGKPIFRGVGNFIFDQFDKPSTSTSMAVRLRKEGDRVLFETLRTKE